MRRHIQLGAFVTAGLATLLASPALADVTDINSVKIQERRFNDYPGSTLITTNSYPSLVRFVESDYGAGGFANHHNARFSSDGGATDRSFGNAEAFDISMELFLDAGSLAPTKEAGFRMDSFIGGEGFFIVKTNGEAAAFGGPFPFHSFGASAYSPGTTVTMQMIYTPDDDADPFDGDAATMEYIFNGASSGPLDFSNTENGMISGSDLGVYVQSVPDTGNPGDFVVAEFTNFEVAVPEPSALILLALGGAIAMRRRTTRD